MIQEINHVTYVVSDLERTSLLFQNIFDAEEVYSCQTAKYLTINGIWLAIYNKQYGLGGDNNEFCSFY